MSDKTLNIREFNKRLWLSGGRDQLPAGAMRRCVGAAPELTRSLVSRWGSTSLHDGISAISLTKYNGIRYQYNGSNLYKAGISIDSGYNGGRLAWVKAPPAFGLSNYLFLTGGGKLKKVDASGNITNWGIAAPLDGMNAALGTRDLLSIDTFVASAANWTAASCAVADEGSIVYSGAGSLKVMPTSGAWTITKDLTGSPLNMAVYANNDISLQSDYVSLWVYMKKPSNVVWLWIMFDVNDGTFKKDYYRLVVQVVPNTANVHAADAAVIISADADRWFQIAAPKSIFQRIGNALELDWSTVKKIRIEGGDPAATTGPPLYFDLFELFGGFPLGEGPAAIQNGSTYQYLVTFGSDITGNDSNPNDTPTTLNGVALHPANLSQIPVSTDSQTTNRKLWRTSANGAIFFFLDIIHDNTTTTYVDKIADLPGQPWIVTPWQKNVAVIANYYADGGNGFYFKVTTPGTTGAALPTWNVPNSVWGSVSAFATLNETILPRESPSSSAWKVTTTGITGLTEPNWALAGPITDGTVVWTKVGALTTVDNTVTWTCIGLNSLQSLGTQQLRYDNIVFPSTMQDAVFFKGSVYGCRDSANPGNVYISPSGRSEGYGVVLHVSTDDDKTVKLVVWDETVWLFTENYIYPLNGDYPDIVPGDHVEGALGAPLGQAFTIIDTPYGIFYQAAEDIRIFSRARNVPVGFEALAPIERGQSAENVSPFTAVIAASTKNEIWFSDGVVTFAYAPIQDVWRMPGFGASAFFYEDDTGIIEASVGGSVVSVEAIGALTDGTSPIPIEWQTPSELLDDTQQTMTKRIFIDVNCNGQVLTPTLLVDNLDIALPAITGSGRMTIPIAKQKAGRLLGIRITGNVVQRVELFGIWSEVREGRAGSRAQILESLFDK